MLECQVRVRMEEVDRRFLLFSTYGFLFSFWLTPVPSDDLDKRFVLGETLTVPLLNYNLIVAGHLFDVDLYAEASVGVDFNILRQSFTSKEDAQGVLAIKVRSKSLSFKGDSASRRRFGDATGNVVTEGTSIRDAGRFEGQLSLRRDDALQRFAFDDDAANWNLFLLQGGKNEITREATRSSGVNIRNLEGDLVSCRIQLIDAAAGDSDLRYLRAIHCYFVDRAVQNDYELACRADLRISEIFERDARARTGIDNRGYGLLHGPETGQVARSVPAIQNQFPQTASIGGDEDGTSGREIEGGEVRYLF